MRRRASPVLDPGRPADLGAGGLRPLPRRAAARGRAGVDAARARTGPAAGDAGGRGLQGGGGDRRQGRQRAGARLAARPPAGDRRGRRRRRGRGRRHGRARPRGGRRPRARAGARRQVPRPGRRGRLRDRRAARVLGRQLDVGPGGAGPSGRRLRRPGRRLRLRAGPVRQRGRHQPGGRVLALRDVAARARVGARLGDRRQRRDLRRAAGGVPADRGPRSRAARSTSSRRGGGRSTCRPRGRRRRWCRPSRASGRASGG